MSAATMPKKRPNPRLGLQGRIHATMTYTTTITRPTVAAISRLRGSFGRRAHAKAMVRASSQGGRHAVEILEGDPDRRSVGTHLHAGRPLRPGQAQVAL